jgi:hypothetical protein
MRKPEELSPEDRQRVDEVTHTGIHSVERKPFRPLFLLVMLILVTSLLSVVSIVIHKLIIP